jgi:hypothetical protein
MQPRASILLLAEDLLGLAFGRRLVQEHAELTVWRETNARGSGAIKRDIRKYDSMARNGFPVLALTDLDDRVCCGLLFDEWFGAAHRPHANLLVRVCVREAESWLMADPDALADLLRVPRARLPLQPETLADPKGFLLALASGASKRIRNGLLPAPNSTARIGPEYNDLLCQVVATKWDIGRAAKRCPSLAMARQRLGEFATRVGA